MFLFVTQALWVSIVRILFFWCAIWVYLKSPGLSMGHIYLSHSHPTAIYACRIPSRPMGRFPLDSDRNDISMDKPGNH